MRLLVALALLLLAIPSGAESLIGLFADEYGDHCWADIQPYVEIQLHLLVFLDSHDMAGGFTAAEFRLENWPGNPGYPLGTITTRWSSDLVLGEIDDDFTIAFSEAQQGPIVNLGSVTLQMFSEDWIEEDHRVVVGEGLDCGCIAVIDNLFEYYDAEGLQFTFNCQQPCSCIPGSLSAESNWSRIKSLF